jgi:hypothetical protein
MNTEYIKIKPDTSHKNTVQESSWSQSSKPMAKNYLDAKAQEELIKLDTNMKVSEFKAIDMLRTPHSLTYGKNDYTFKILAVQALINTI